MLINILSSGLFDFTKLTVCKIQMKAQGNICSIFQRVVNRFLSTLTAVLKKLTTSGAGFTKPPLKWASFSKGRIFFLQEGHLKMQFRKSSFNSPYQKSSLKLEGANAL